MIFVFLFLLSFSLSLSSNPLCGNFLTFLQRGVQGAKVVNGTDLFFLWAQTVKNLLSMQETQVRFLGQEDLLEEVMASQSRTLAWRIPWTEEPGGLQSMGSQRVGRD